MDKTIFVLMGKWNVGDDAHIIGLFSSREKAQAHAHATLNAKTDPMMGSAPSCRAEAWIEGEFWVQ